MKKLILACTAGIFLLSGCSFSAAAENADENIVVDEAVVEDVDTNSATVCVDNQNKDSFVIQDTDGIIVLNSCSTILPSDLDKDQKVELTYLNGVLSTVQVITESKTS